MLTRDEVLNLLSAAAAYDNRKPADATVLAWAEAARRGRWDFRAALDAIHDHYARTTEFLMPGHVTAALRTRRTPPPPVRELPAPTGPPAAPEHIAAVRDRVARALRWNVPDPGEREAGQTRRCPHCQAAPGEPCTRPSERARSGRVPLARMHPSRIEEPQP